MRRFLLLLMACLWLTACSSDKESLTSYIEQTDQVSVEMIGLSQEYQKLGEDILRTMGGSPQTPDSISALARTMKGRIDGLQQKANGLVDRIAKAQAPEKASRLHELQLSTYQEFSAAIQAYGEFTAELGKGPTMDRNKVRQLTEAFQKKLEASQAQAKESGMERQRLVREFGLTVPEPKLPEAKAPSPQ